MLDAVFQPTAQAMVIDDAGRLLLFSGAVSNTALTEARCGVVGSGAGESLNEAASRELAEETGPSCAKRSAPRLAAAIRAWYQGSDGSRRSVRESFDRHPARLGGRARARDGRGLRCRRQAFTSTGP
jgi:hypothetical protein